MHHLGSVTLHRSSYGPSSYTKVPFKPSVHPPVQDLGADELAMMTEFTEMDAEPRDLLGSQEVYVPLNEHWVILGQRTSPLQGHKGFSQRPQKLDQQRQIDVVRAAGRLWV